MSRKTDLQALQVAYKAKLRILLSEAEAAKVAGCGAVYRRKMATVVRLRKMKRSITERNKGSE